MTDDRVPVAYSPDGQPIYDLQEWVDNQGDQCAVDPNAPKTAEQAMLDAPVSVGDAQEADIIE